MVGDGLRHFGLVDVPMGEFWFRSPTHDKPNDILDAVSGAHIYGKRIVQAEAFTELRTLWDEHPGMLKTLQDRNYALGVNRLVYHVFAHNPWLDRAPGMTLDGVGLYFQRDQTWWRPGRAWVSYAARCQALLQRGVPVVDVAVFTGEDVPSRAVLPNRLVDIAHKLLRQDLVEAERTRMANVGLPLKTEAGGVKYSANTFSNENWSDPLSGYAYDSINRDALLRLGEVKGGKLTLPGGAEYAALFVPTAPWGRKEAAPLSKGLQARLAEFEQAGLQVFKGDVAGDIVAPKDFLVVAKDGGERPEIAWTHRRDGEQHLYFVSNQENRARSVEVSLRVTGLLPEIWHPVTGESETAPSWNVADARTVVALQLEAAESVFIVLREAAKQPDGGSRPLAQRRKLQDIAGPWRVTFPGIKSGTAATADFAALSSWTRQTDPAIRYFSGTASYECDFESTGAKPASRVYLNLGSVANLAEVTVNGVPCGVTWTPPHRVEVTAAVRAGNNRLRIDISNTWANRLAFDRTLPTERRQTWTNAPDRMKNEQLLDAGLLGPVTLEIVE
jgi:hypothetical protein